MTKRQTKKSVKKVLQKSKHYGILYKKVDAEYERFPLGGDVLLRMGSKYFSKRASVFDGDIFFKKKLRQIRTAAEQLIW